MSAPPEADPARVDLCAGLRRAGQSVWLDHLDRELLATGRLRELIASGSVSGLTSNPSITATAIGGTGYEQSLRDARRAGHSAVAAMEHLLLEDARAAAALLAPIHAASAGVDGFVSVEVSPALALDSAATVEAGRRLHHFFGHPNLLVRVPGNEAGLRAVTELTREGIGTDVTLLFSAEAVGRAERAYLDGLRARHHAGQPLEAVASVASLFVRRIDSIVDARLETLDSGRGELLSMRAQAATALATLAWAAWHAAGLTAEWRALARDGGRRQRLLFASMSVRERLAPATRYVRSFVYRDTIVTLPPATLSAALAEPWGGGAAPMPTDVAEGWLARLSAAGVDLERTIRALERDGLATYQAAEESALTRVAQRLLAG